MRSAVWIFSAFLLSFAPVAMADDHLAPPVAAGIQAWLSDDDAKSLRDLAAAAKSGDADAQLFLAQIEATTPSDGETDWLATLDAAARGDLFPVGDQSWSARRLAAGDPLAQAFLDARSEAISIDMAYALHDAGEIAAARRLAWALIQGGDIGWFVSPDLSRSFVANLDYLNWVLGWVAGGANAVQQIKWIKVSPVDGRLMGAMLIPTLQPIIAANLTIREETKYLVDLLQGAPGDLLEADAKELVEIKKLFGRQIRQDPALKAVQSLCNTACSGDMGWCLMGAATVLGGYDAVVASHTPVEKLVPQADYLASARAVNTLERRLRAAFAADEDRAWQADQLSQCLAIHLE